MKDQKTEDSQKILSIEEYKKKQKIASQTTATGDVLQTPSEERDKTASILVFDQKKTSTPNQTKYPVSSEKNIIYMKNYLSSVGISDDSFEDISSPVQTFDGDNIVMMSEYLKRKIPEQMESSDWTNNMSPPHSTFQKWTAAVAVAVLVMVAFPFFNKYSNEEGQRGLAGDKAILNGQEPDQMELFEEGQEARRGLQSLPAENSSLSINQSAIISAGRKPTKEEQLNGY